MTRRSIRGHLAAGAQRLARQLFFIEDALELSRGPRGRRGFRPPPGPPTGRALVREAAGSGREKAVGEDGLVETRLLNWTVQTSLPGIQVKSRGRARRPGRLRPGRPRPGRRTSRRRHRPRPASPRPSARAALRGRRPGGQGGQREAPGDQGRQGRLQAGRRTFPHGGFLRCLIATISNPGAVARSARPAAPPIDRASSRRDQAPTTSRRAAFAVRCVLTTGRPSPVASSAERPDLEPRSR